MHGFHQHTLKCIYVFPMEKVGVNSGIKSQGTTGRGPLLASLSVDGASSMAMGGVNRSVGIGQSNSIDSSFCIFKGMILQKKNQQQQQQPGLVCI